MNHLLDAIPADIRRRLDSLAAPWALVGGALRCALQGLDPRDLDIMTWAPPVRMVEAFADVPEPICRAYPSRALWSYADRPGGWERANLGVRWNGVDIWSADAPLMRGLPDVWPFDFTINAAALWSDGTFRCHPSFHADVAARVLRPLRLPVQAYRIEKFLALGYRLAVPREDAECCSISPTSG